MERRAENRIPFNVPVRVTLLTTPPEHFDAVLVNISGRGARLRVPRRLDSDAALRIDLDNAMLLGEVCYCANHGEAYGIGVILEHSLLNLAKVLEQRAQLLGETEGAQRAAGRV